MRTFKIHLLRSGAAETGEQPVVGQTSGPLSSQGKEELQRLKDNYLYPAVQQVYTSPAAVCVETAEVLYPDTFCLQRAGLEDMDLGAFQGRPYAELETQPAFQAWLENSLENMPPGGETTAGFAQRVVDEFTEIFAEMMDQQLNDVAVVTHGGVIMTLLAAIGLPRAQPLEWAAPSGTGYTLLATTQMWMRDRAVEVYEIIPSKPQQPHPEGFHFL